MRNKRIWLAEEDFDDNKPADAFYDAQNDIWVVRQEGKLIIRCTNLYMRDVRFRANGIVSGFICTAKEINGLADEYGLPENETFEYTCVHYDYEKDRWYDECGIEVTKSTYVDMSTMDSASEMVLAIYTEVHTR
jgi:hypothetical protein